MLPVLSRSTSEPDTDIQAIICGDYEWAWLDFQDGCVWALAVTWCESNWNPNADTNPPYVGWWQVGGGPYDPYLNTVEANIQFVEWMAGIRTVSPWPSCSPEKP